MGKEKRDSLPPLQQVLLEQTKSFVKHNAANFKGFPSLLISIFVLFSAAALPPLHNDELFARWARLRTNIQAKAIQTRSGVMGIFSFVLKIDEKAMSVVKCEAASLLNN